MMRVAGTSVNNRNFFTSLISSIQRKCAHYEEEEKKMQRRNEQWRNCSQGINRKLYQLIKW
jgi:hypothetical protein